MINSKPKQGNRITEWLSDIKNIIILLIAILSAINTLRFENTKKEIDLSMASLLKEHAEKKFSNDALFQLYRELKNSINTDDCEEQGILLTIVDEVMADNLSVRDSLRKFIIKKNPKCNSLATTIKKNLNEEKLFNSVRIEKIDMFTIDVFYLEVYEAEAKKLAKIVQNELKNEFSKDQYLIRLRLLPNTINAQSGYKIDFNQIRYDDSESSVADKILSIIVDKKIFNLEQPSKKLIKNQTENYISIFIRNM